jgi:hypothetical protein
LLTGCRWERTRDFVEVSLGELNSEQFVGLLMNEKAMSLGAVSHAIRIAILSGIEIAEEESDADPVVEQYLLELALRKLLLQIAECWILSHQAFIVEYVHILLPYVVAAQV